MTEKYFKQVDFDERWVLEGDAAIELWLQGQEAWNAEIAKHPKADVSFKGCDFSKHCQWPEVTFTGFRFPDKGLVSFEEAKFNCEHVSFRGANFGDGYVNFRNAFIYGGNLDFSSVQFGNMHVSFRGATLECNILIFNNASFGSVDFSGCNINSVNGWADFQKTKFTGNVDFNGCSIVGDTDFKAATFAGNLSFENVSFNEYKVDFSQALFKGHTDFSNLKDSIKIKELSFSKSIFEKSFDLTSNHFSCIPDLVGTKTSSHVSLHGVHCELKRNPIKSYLPCLKAATCSGDVEKLRRLKELAESNKDHSAALRFHADELRAKRWNKDHGMGCVKSILDFVYSATSDYGQSIIRPVLLLLFISALVGSYLMLYKCLNLTETLNLLAANAVPFVASSKTILKDTSHPVAGLLLLFHGLSSFIFIFLIGLGFRNRFRV